MHIKIIAEAGVNHNGSLALAKQLALKARDAGADLVKYQTFVPELLATGTARKADYQEKNTGDGGSQLDMLRKLCLTFDEYRELREYCDEIGIAFLSAAFDLKSVALLAEMDMPFWKIPSGEVTDLPYLEAVGRTHKPVVLSTGMCVMEDVAEAIDALRRSGAGEITLMHCTTQYPTPPEDVNLLAMDALRERFGLPVGYSDHTRGISIPVAAAARGAVMLEKHFTLDRGMEGPDHRASLEPDELRAMVDAVRAVERALGDGVKRPRGDEQKTSAVARKSVVAAAPIARGEALTEENLTTKRPGTGISPMRWHDVLGKAANRDYAEDELIDEAVLGGA